MYTAQGLLLTKSQFPVGRHEAVKLKEVVKGDNFIDYIYASPQGDMESNKRT